MKREQYAKEDYEYTILPKVDDFLKAFVKDAIVESLNLLFLFKKPNKITFSSMPGPLNLENCA